MCADLASNFPVLKDPRYPLDAILLLSICAVVSGAEGWEGIETFGRAKLDWLGQFLPYENGTPANECIAWVMAELSPKAMQ